MIRPIIQKEQKTLRQKSKAVPARSIKGEKIQKIIKEMKESLASQHDGVAIAAPQIGYNLRIFVISGRILDPNFGSENQSENSNTPDAVFINPEITKLSREKTWVEEGCLSVRWLYGKTNRHKKVTITAYDELGKKFTRGASGLLAQAFQHETDHLNGILFIDHAKDIIEHLPE